MHRACEPVYCNGEVIEYDHPGVILTRETVERFSFIIIMGFGIIAAGVVTIRTIISGTIVTGNIVLLVVIDFFDERTGGTMSRGSAFPSGEASELQDGGREVPSAGKGTESSGMTSVGSCDGFRGICMSSARVHLNSSGHWCISELVQMESLNILSRPVLR